MTKPYVKTIDGELAVYPYSLAQLRQDFPNVSFPAEPSDADLAPFGVAAVQPGTKPAFNPVTQRLVHDNPTLQGGQWVEGYTVVDIPVVDLADNLLRLREHIAQSTQNRLDNFSATRGYDSVISAAKYKDISDAEIDAMPADERPLVQKFRTEARYLAATTARTWAKLYLILAMIESGQVPMPSAFSDIEPLLPALEWPQ